MRGLFGMFLLLLWSLGKCLLLVHGIKVLNFGVGTSGNVFLLSSFLRLLLRVHFYMNWLVIWYLLLLDWRMERCISLVVRKEVKISELSRLLMRGLSLEVIN